MLGNFKATKYTEQRYKYAVDWLRYCLHGALYRFCNESEV